MLLGDFCYSGTYSKNASTSTPSASAVRPLITQPRVVPEHFLPVRWAKGTYKLPYPPVLS